MLMVLSVYVCNVEWLLSTGRYDYEQLFDSVLEASEIWAENMSYDTRFAQQRELEKTQMQVGEPAKVVRKAIFEERRVKITRRGRRSTRTSP